jgi:hypothetical protein
MLLIDMSNLAFGTVIDYCAKTKEKLDMDLVRRLIIGRVADVKTKLKVYADEIVLCYDGRKYWRRDEFPEYKGKRAEGREKMTFDWEAFFPMYEQLKKELEDYFPWKSVTVHRAEADDVIAVLATIYGNHKDVCIWSSDHDYIQIQQNVCPKVKQFSGFHKKFLTPKNHKYDMFEHVVKGDTGDGIPNILSDDDTFLVKGKRQKSISKKTLEEWSKYGLSQPEKFCKDFDTLKRFERNMKLVDFRRIPEDLQCGIRDTYEACDPPKGKIFNYLAANRLTKLMAAGQL